MPKVKHAPSSRKRRKKTLKAAKGQWGGRSRLFRIAKVSVKRGMVTSYVGRKKKKRDMRSLWIARINAACRQEGLSYNKFISGLKKQGVMLNRKMLADIAVCDHTGFKSLIKSIKQ